jgi:hypothetical protein
MFQIFLEYLKFIFCNACRSVPYTPQVWWLLSSNGSGGRQAGNYDAPAQRQKPQERQASQAGLASSWPIVVAGNKSPRRMRGSNVQMNLHPPHCS